MNISELQREYRKAFRAWHVAWTARADWHREQFFPLRDEGPGLVYEEVITRHRELKVAEERAYDRFLHARDVLSQAPAADGSD